METKEKMSMYRRDQRGFQKMNGILKLIHCTQNTNINDAK